MALPLKKKLFLRPPKRSRAITKCCFIFDYSIENLRIYTAMFKGYNFTMDIEGLNGIGIPNNKIVWGLMPGHHDAGNEYTTLEQAKAAAE